MGGGGGGGKTAYLFRVTCREVWKSNRKMSNIYRVFFINFSYDSEDSRDSMDSKQDDQMVGFNCLMLISILCVTPLV